ncbi:hypothetical protein IMZ48_24240 [Candidatus Bathyarchaeota archaeon]|nr:hypothetical protein [Candidatus Bathyarchaeota archaeon]
MAFGPHGPRALDPPGEGKSLLFHIFLTFVATGGIFATVRYFGGEAPESMNQEWQEKSNEYLKVRCLPPPGDIPRPRWISHRTNATPTGATIRPPHRCRLGRLQGYRHDPVPPQGCLKRPSQQHNTHIIISIISASYIFRPLSRQPSFSFVNRAKRIFGSDVFSGKLSRTFSPWPPCKKQQQVLSHPRRATAFVERGCDNRSKFCKATIESGYQDQVLCDAYTFASSPMSLIQSFLGALSSLVIKPMGECLESSFIRNAVS